MFISNLHFYNKFSALLATNRLQSSVLIREFKCIPFPSSPSSSSAIRPQDPHPNTSFQYLCNPNLNPQMPEISHSHFHRISEVYMPTTRVVFNHESNDTYPWSGPQPSVHLYCQNFTNYTIESDPISIMERRMREGWRLRQLQRMEITSAPSMLKQKISQMGKGIEICCLIYASLSYALSVHVRVEYALQMCCVQKNGGDMEKRDRQTNEREDGKDECNLHSLVAFLFVDVKVWCSPNMSKLIKVRTVFEIEILFLLRWRNTVGE
jgi:hypothetical protein